MHELEPRLHFFCSFGMNFNYLVKRHMVIKFYNNTVQFQYSH